MDLSPHIVGEMVETTLNMDMLTTDGSDCFNHKKLKVHIDVLWITAKP